MIDINNDRLCLIVRVLFTISLLVLAGVSAVPCFVVAVMVFDSPSSINYWSTYAVSYSFLSVPILIFLAAIFGNIKRKLFFIALLGPVLVLLSFLSAKIEFGAF